MPIEGAKVAGALGARRNTRGGGDDVPRAASTTGDGAPAARADGVLAGAGLAQRSAAADSAAAAAATAADGAAGIAGPLTYRWGALAGVPQGLERGKRLDVRV